MDKPELFSKQAGQSAAQIVDEMARLYFLSRAIHVVAEFKIADHLGHTIVAIDEIARKSGTDLEALRRLLRFLSGYGVFEEKSHDQFCNTELSATLREDHPNSLAASFRRIGDFWWSAAGKLDHSIRTGESAFTHFHGISFFQYLKAHPEIQNRFDAGMASRSDSDDIAVASAYDFTRFRRIVDVGGGKGGLLVQILKRAPAAIGILYEQPQVLERATRLNDAGLSARSELVAGDFFQSVPAGCDCYIIKGVLHDFSDETCIGILSNCRKSMTPDGRVIIANQDLPAEVDGPHPNRTMDIQMMTLLHGRERTLAEWSELMLSAGLALGDAFPTKMGYVLVEGKLK